MSTTRLDVFDHTVHQTNVWIKELMEEMRTDSRHTAYQALRGTLHALRDRLTVDEAAHLGAQLPMLIAGLYYQGWSPSDNPTKIRTRPEFLERIRQSSRDELGSDPEHMARSVFRMLRRRISAGEIQDILSTMPEELRGLWETG